MFFQINPAYVSGSWYVKEFHCLSWTMYIQYRSGFSSAPNLSSKLAAPPDPAEVSRCCAYVPV